MIWSNTYLYLFWNCWYLYAVAKAAVAYFKSKWQKCILHSSFLFWSCFYFAWWKQMHCRIWVENTSFCLFSSHNESQDSGNGTAESTEKVERMMGKCKTLRHCRMLYYNYILFWGNRKYVLSLTDARWRCMQ